MPKKQQDKPKRGDAPVQSTPEPQETRQDAPESTNGGEVDTSPGENATFPSDAPEMGTVAVSGSDIAKGPDTVEKEKPQLVTVEAMHEALRLMTRHYDREIEKLRQSIAVLEAQGVGVGAVAGKAVPGLRWVGEVSARALVPAEVLGRDGEVNQHALNDYLGAKVEAGEAAECPGVLVSEQKQAV